VVRESTICSLSRANDRDIARAAEALAPAERKRIHTFIATSPLHMEMKLRMEPEQVLLQAKLAVRFARHHTDDIEFSPGRRQPLGRGFPVPRAGSRDRRRRDHDQLP
jgi:2-isopropylmalate synthase